jgi:hypothetical protein
MFSVIDELVRTAPLATKGNRLLSIGDRLFNRACLRLDLSLVAKEHDQTTTFCLLPFHLPAGDMQARGKAVHTINAVLDRAFPDYSVSSKTNLVQTLSSVGKNPVRPYS